MPRAFILALGSLLLAGCALTGSRTSAPHGGSSADASPIADATRIVPSPAQVVGRIIAIDPRTLIVVIELDPFATIPARLTDRMLVSRVDDLRPTSQLQASAYLRGRTLGARLVAGRPQLGDEVVLVPMSL